MSTRFLYLEITCSDNQSRLSVKQSIEEAVKCLFGECGAASLCVDVLSARSGRALLRVRACDLRRLRAALLLRGPSAPATAPAPAPALRVCRQACSLQALL